MGGCLLKGGRGEKRTKNYLDPTKALQSITQCQGRHPLENVLMGIEWEAEPWKGIREKPNALDLPCSNRKNSKKEIKRRKERA